MVTGTLLDGPLAIGDDLVVIPSGTAVRVRGLQSHEQSLESAAPGTRVAVNVTGVERDDVARGSMLARPGHWLTTSRFVATIRTARYVDELTNRGAYHLHLGSGSWPARIRHIDGGLVRIYLDGPVPAAMGDRFILRDSGRRLVVGGGRVVDPDPPRPKRFSAASTRALIDSLEAPPDGRADALLAFRGTDSSDRLSAHTGGGTPTDGFRHGNVWLSRVEQQRIGEQMIEAVARYHVQHPLRPGIGIAELAESLGLPTGVVSALAGTLDGVGLDGAFVSSRDFAVDFTPDQRSTIDAAKRALEAAGTTAVPRVPELGVDPTLLHAAVRAGEFVQVSGEFVYLPEQIDELLAVIESFDEPFGVSEFKDRAGLSRKYAVPFLEWTDDTGRTVRTGDTRRKR